MAAMTVKTYILITNICLLLFLFASINTSRTNFQVKRFGVCNQTQGIVKFYGNITKEGEEYYLNYIFDSPFEWGDNIGTTCMIELKSMGRFMELFTIREKNACKAAHKYMGEFWYDIERAAQLPRGVCPWPAGKREVHHRLLDFRKITLQTFPFGRLRFTIKTINNSNKDMDVLCLLIEVENVVN